MQKLAKSNREEADVLSRACNAWEEKLRILRLEGAPGSRLGLLYHEIEAFNDRYFPGWRKTSLLYVSNAMAGESGEVSEDVLGVVLASTSLSAKVGKLADLVKHYFGGGTNAKSPTYVDLAEEGVDVFFYLVIFFGALGGDVSTFESSIEAKLAKVRERMEARKNGERRSP